jgi:hypothetical protein
MATMLYQTDSAAKMLRMGRRHIRLCSQLGANSCAEAIQPKLDALEAKEAERNSAAIRRENAYDTVVLRDMQLDDEVRNVFDSVKMYDRKNMTMFLATLFQSGGYSSLTKIPLSEEPQKVNELALQLENSGVSEFATLATSLKNQANACIEAWTAYQNTLADYNNIIAAEVLLKNDVRQQYEYNWLDARKARGVTYADRLFPKIIKQTEIATEPPQQV